MEDNRSHYIQQAKIFDALSDPTRLRMIELLAKTDEMSSSELAGQLGISLALFCHHSKTLLEVDLVTRRQEGQTKYLSLNHPLLNDCLQSLAYPKKTYPNL
jgi:DNA-binding transcriptional ArsR family regulator